MSPVVGVWVVCVHVLNCIEYADRVECVIVLVYMVLHHGVKEIPTNIIIWSYASVGI